MIYLSRWHTGIKMASMVLTDVPVHNSPDGKVNGANMGPIWGRQDPGGPHVGPMTFAIWVIETEWCTNYTSHQNVPSLIQIMSCRMYLNQCWPIVSWAISTNVSEISIKIPIVIFRNALWNVVCNIWHLDLGSVYIMDVRSLVNTAQRI